jgi:hypothetical protein
LLKKRNNFIPLVTGIPDDERACDSFAKYLSGKFSESSKNTVLLDEFLQLFSNVKQMSYHYFYASHN